jgi:hypothetical protein
VDAGLHDQAFALQSSAGNRAMASLFGVQRAPDDTTSNQPPAPSKAHVRWTDADKSGKAWNRDSTTVDKTSMRRIPVEGLRQGNQVANTGVENKKTTESAAGKAIVILPEAFKLDDDQPVRVMLHLHGWTHRKEDPYAGWRQRSGASEVAGITLDAGSVRDVALDRIEEQMEAAGDTQLIGVLAQGTGESFFGGDLNADSYIREVLGGVVASGELAAVPKSFEVVLSAHSGGGSTVVNMLEGGAKGGAPGQLGEVVLFEAINVNWAKGHRHQLDVVEQWVLGHLNRLGAILADPSATETEKATALAKTPVFRGYYGVNGSYDKAYIELDGVIDKWFKKAPDMGTWTDRLRDLFRVIPLYGAVHETSVRGLGEDPTAGPMADALRANLNPHASSRLDQGEPPKPGGKKKGSARAEAEQPPSDDDAAVAASAAPAALGDAEAAVDEGALATS